MCRSANNDWHSIGILNSIDNWQYGIPIPTTLTDSIVTSDTSWMWCGACWILKYWKEGWIPTPSESHCMSMMKLAILHDDIGSWLTAQIVRFNRSWNRSQNRSLLSYERKRGTGLFSTSPDLNESLFRKDWAQIGVAGCSNTVSADRIVADHWNKTDKELSAFEFIIKLILFEPTFVFPSQYTFWSTARARPTLLLQ